MTETAITDNIPNTTQTKVSGKIETGWVRVTIAGTMICRVCR